MKIPVSVIILTYNEEKNIRACLESVKDWAQDIFVVDSFSDDATEAIVKEYTPNFIQHAFENYSAQRNWAFLHLPLQTEWVMNLDADHRVMPELKAELITVFTKEIAADINGFLTSRRTIFMDKWIKYGGHYPTYHSILFRKGKGKCEERKYDQHFLVEGKTEKLKGDVIDVFTDSLSTFTQRHNKWSTLEAEEQFFGTLKNNTELVKADIGGNAIQKRRYMKNTYDRFP